MKLYYFPGACSLACHIALRETGAAFEIEKVDTKSKKTAGGADYLGVNAKGYVPTLELDNGQKLTEAQVQDLLRFAIGDGGLGVARAEYQNPLVADAPTAVFELNADGGSKKVSVVALGMGGEPGPDAAIKASLAKLGDQLMDFDRGGTLSSDPFEPAAYRAVLIDAGRLQDGARGIGAGAGKGPVARVLPGLARRAGGMPGDRDAIGQLVDDLGDGAQQNLGAIIGLG